MPDDLNRSAGQDVSVSVGRGAFIHSDYVERHVMVYAIHDNELQTISVMNALTMTFSSVGSALLSFAVGVWTNGAFQTPMPPPAEVLTKVGAPSACLLALVFFGLAGYVYMKRHGMIDKIKRESISTGRP